MTNTRVSPERTSSAAIGRRRLMHTTAWAIPTGVISAAAPAMAVSDSTETPPDMGEDTIGLQGLMNLGKGCKGFDGGYKLDINMRDLTDTKPVYDENGEKVQYGFYVLGAGPDQEPSNARFTVYLPDTLGIGGLFGGSWKNLSPRSGWSNFERDTSVRQYRGLHAYTSTFSGNWTHSVVDGESRWVAAGPPPRWGVNPTNLSYNGTAKHYCKNRTLPITGLRRVIVDGEELSFQRSTRV